MFPKRGQRGRTMENAVGLVMTGGGARGAYQAGVLKRIGELKRARTQGNPFPIIGGASAGAINGAALATGCGDSPAFRHLSLRSFVPGAKFPNLDIRSLLWRDSGGRQCPIVIRCHSLTPFSQ